MIKMLRTDSENIDFKALVGHLDRDLAERDGEDHAFYDQFNKISGIKQAVVGYENGIPVGCGALKEFEKGIMEIKRMFVLPKLRGKGIATSILTELETWAKELDCDKCILETGKRQPEAIALYKKSGYQIIPNYGQYTKVLNSICFEKALWIVD
jgi:GNAT superfamily N-acetyltransferase